MLKNSEIRALSRKQLGGNIFSRKWFSFLDVFLIFYAISFIFSFLYSFVAQATVLPELALGAEFAVMPLFLILMLLEFLTLPVFTYGFYRMSVVFVREGRASVGALFSGFAHFFRVLWLYIVEFFFLYLWMLLFFIPGFVKTYSYAMAPYIRQDNWKCTASECITKSRELMRGHKWRLFCLDLSFIGWYILGALCLGVGVLFVSCYHYVARANFYNELLKSRRPANAVTASN